MITISKYINFKFISLYVCKEVKEVNLETGIDLAWAGVEFTAKKIVIVSISDNFQYAA